MNTLIRRPICKFPRSPSRSAQRGEYQWILAELHPPVALLHHGMYWGCPDKPLFARALASTTCGQPNFHFGFFAGGFHRAHDGAACLMPCRS